MKKTLRYYYWLILEFFKKHFKLIIISTIVSFIFIIGIISITPFFETFFSNKTEIYGMVGSYDVTNLPDEIYSKISTGLLYINDKGEIKPTLTSTWEVRNNGKSYRFYLKKSLIWNDGKPFLAKDINYQFKDIQVKIINDNTIDFILTKPLLTFPGYLKKPIIRQPLIGVGGLYKVNHIKSVYGNISELSLEPNSKNLPFLIYKFYQNENQITTAYKKGEISTFKIDKKSVADIFMNWKNTNVVKAVDYTKLLTIFFNFNNPILKDKNFKDAIIKSIDQESLKEIGELARGPIPPISWAYNNSIKPILYDPDTAEKIIKKTLSSTPEAQLNLATYYDYYDVADQISTMLKKVGLNPTLSISSFGKPNNFDLLIAYWKVPDDPDQYYFWHSTQVNGNIGQYNNVKIDKLLEDGRNTMSIEDRKRIYFEFQRIINDDPPAIFLYYPYVYTIRRK
jgi:peptide/nickel transport system substrate-binding protein